MMDMPSTGDKDLRKLRQRLARALWKLRGTATYEAEVMQAERLEIRKRRGLLARGIRRPQ